jgi:hypothetical protein
MALYREGRNAEQNYFIGYAVLSYYKIIELKFGDFEGPKVRDWIAANYPALKADNTLVREIANFEKKRGNEEPQKYLNSACRVAVAHSSVTNPSDPDELPELRRLHVAAHILRALARRFIRDELSVSECPYDGSYVAHELARDVRVSARFFDAPDYSGEFGRCPASAGHSFMRGLSGAR